MEKQRISPYSPDMMKRIVEKAKERENKDLSIPKIIAFEKIKCSEYTPINGVKIFKRGNTDAE